MRKRREGAECVAWKGVGTIRPTWSDDRHRLHAETARLQGSLVILCFIPRHMLLAPIHEAFKALLRGHDHDFSSVAVRDESRRVDLCDSVFQSPAVTAGPGRKNDSAIHAVPGCIVLCRLYARCAGLVPSRSGPVVDFSFQIDKVARTPRIDAVTHN